MEIGNCQIGTFPDYFCLEPDAGNRWWALAVQRIVFVRREAILCRRRFRLVCRVARTADRTWPHRTLTEFVVYCAAGDVLSMSTCWGRIFLLSFLAGANHLSSHPRSRPKRVLRLATLPSSLMTARLLTVSKSGLCDHVKKFTRNCHPASHTVDGACKPKWLPLNFGY